MRSNLTFFYGIFLKEEIYFFGLAYIVIASQDYARGEEAANFWKIFLLHVSLSCNENGKKFTPMGFLCHPMKRVLFETGDVLACKYITNSICSIQALTSHNQFLKYT